MTNKPDEIRYLIKQMRKKDLDITHAASKVLQDNGWLYDGSLVGLNLKNLNLELYPVIKLLDDEIVFPENYILIDWRDADLRDVDLSNSDLSGVNLSNANLSNANLTDADLSEANLENTNLSGTDLLRANFFGSKLRNANLGGAYLIGADFRQSDLSEADFSQADLQDAIFAQSDLTQAKFNEAICGGTFLSEIDLSNVIGLETVTHDAPSYIGIETLYLSRGKIPEIFLRGCGIPESLITYLPSIMNTAIDFYSCFISYSHGDQSFARRVHDTLQGRGIRCWLDEKEMLPGDDIYKEIDRGIRYWDKVLLCCSKSSLSEKWWVDHEIDKAFQKERDLNKERGEKVLSLIPLDLDGYLFSDECADKNPKTQQIRSRIAGNFNGWEHDNALFEREIEKVIRALRTDGGKAPLPPSKL